MPLNLQGAGSMVNYPAAAVVTHINSSDLTELASGQGAIATLNSDSGGNLKSIVLTIPGMPRVTPVIISSLTSDTTIAAQNVADTLTENFGSASSIGHTLTQVSAGQTLSSSAYGIWILSGSSVSPQLGTYAIGNLTPAASMPMTGSATFIGNTIGANNVTDKDAIHGLQGIVQIIANFSNQTATTNLTNLVVRNPPYYPASPISVLPDLTGVSAMSGNGYVGPISGGGLAGTIHGNFYGSTAQETAGVWQASGGGITWVGSYGAK